MKRGLKNTLLALLGFSASPMLTACYGVQYDIYDPVEIKGTVTDEAYNPIEGIRVTLQNDYLYGYYSENADAALYTDAEGKFALTVEGMPTLVADDVDGAENGGLYNSAKRKITSKSDRVVNIVMKKAE